MPLRIAHVMSTRGVAGAERIMAALVAEGQARDCAQLVLVPFASDGSEKLAEVCQPAAYRARSCASPLALPQLWRWVRQELADFQPDVVHAWLFHATVTVATIPDCKDTARVLTHAYGEGIRLSRNAWVREHLDRWAGRRFDRVVGLSDSVCRFLLAEYRYPPAKVLRISPGWEGQPKEAVKGVAPTILCVAKLRPEKGHDLLLDAFDLVRREVPEARLVLAGNGDELARLTTRCEAMGLGDSTQFLGAVDDVWGCLSSAHVFALASRTEAFGIAVLEAMAAGLPVVAPNTGGIPELVVPGVTGQLYPPGDHKEMARHLIDILTSPGMASSMGESARKAAEPLRMDKAVARYYDLYDELLHEKRDAPT